VRSLQLGFRQFRDATPTMAIRQTRQGGRQALLVGETTRTITDVAYQFGFTIRADLPASTRRYRSPVPD
jgi:hypothetical protein